MTAGKVPSASSWFGQPPGLTVLFLTEMWEKFSFYGMRAILVYYMIKRLHFSQEKASLIYGAYSGFIYFTALFGGIASDRLLGRRLSVVIGGTAMALGHFLLTIVPMFYLALVVIALGNGLFLPSVPSQIGGLYQPDDPRREFSFSVYYLGVNLGAFLAPFVCGTLGELYGWHFGFAAAGVGMCLGVATYVTGRRFLPDEPCEIRASRGANSPDRKFEKKTFLLLIAVAVAIVIFRAAYEQIGNTVAVWADTDVDRRVGRFEIPGSWFQSLNPLCVVLFTSVLIRLWTWLSRRYSAGSTLQKMAWGAMIAVGAYLLLAAVARFHSLSGAQASWLWVATYIAILTIAELCILPTALGLFARLAPAGLGATTIAGFYFAAFGGNLAAGSLGTLWGRMSHGAFFGLIAVVAGIAAVALSILDKPVRALESKKLYGFQPSPGQRTAAEV